MSTNLPSSGSHAPACQTGYVRIISEVEPKTQSHLRGSASRSQNQGNGHSLFDLSEPPQLQQPVSQDSFNSHSESAKHHHEKSRASKVKYKDVRSTDAWQDKLIKLMSKRPNYPIGNGLALAAYSYNVNKLVKKMQKQGVNLNEPITANVTLLKYATDSNDQIVMKALRKAGAKGPDD